MNRAVIALGSNIKPEENIRRAQKELAQTFTVLKSSKFVYTDPLLFKDQPDFLNGVVLIETQSKKAEIVNLTKKIEQKMGRQEGANKNGPRKIDLDVVVFNERVVDDDVFERDFLQSSIGEILPELKLTS